MVIVWRCTERHAPQCSALAAASKYCWLELRAVAVVQPRQYQAARQCERHFGRQKMVDVPDGLDVIVARPGH